MVAASALALHTMAGVHVREKQELTFTSARSFTYHAQWFDPRHGTWQDVGKNGRLASDRIDRIALPNFPADTDWGLKLTYEAPSADSGGSPAR